MSVEVVIIRIMLSIFIGGIVGFNREHENMPAGFRTNVLVCLGATIAALIQVQLGYFVLDEIAKNQEFKNILAVDEGRVICQVVSGIGFLGAGTIIKAKGWSIKGLTTAASVWAVGCVGLAIGMGFYVISIIGGMFIIISLVILKKFENKYIVKASCVNLEVQYTNKEIALNEANKIFNKYQINIINIKSINECLIYTIDISEQITANDIMTNLLVNDNITNVNII